MHADPSLRTLIALIATAKGMQRRSTQAAARSRALPRPLGDMPRSAAKNTNGAFSPCMKISQAADNPIKSGSGMVSCSPSVPINT